GAADGTREQGGEPAAGDVLHLRGEAGEQGSAETKSRPRSFDPAPALMLFLLASIFSTLREFISLRHIQDMMGTWGYPLLFGLLFSCGLGVPLPEDIPLILSGYFVANGKMHLVWAAIAAWCGIIGGDCVLYSMGHKYGLAITKVPFIGKHVTAQRIQYAERL